MSDNARHVLVVGAGIAGPVVAYWLAKGGFKVTVVERSPKLMKSGQGIDIEGPAQDVVLQMNLIEKIKSATTIEEGFALVDDNGQQIASVPGILTSELEIMRGDLAEIFNTAAMEMPGVEYLYNTTVSEVQQSPSDVKVSLLKQDDNSRSTRTFHAIIGADGLRSHLRKLTFPSAETEDCFKARDHYVAYFTIPREASDAPNSRWQNAVNGRTVLVRPINKEISSAYLNYVEPSDELEKSIHAGKDMQIETLAKIFADVGGLGPRVVEGMKQASDFYFERIAQVKLSTWSEGRVALVGDAAYAPSPITGVGTALAITGAYTLAGELATQPDNPLAAFGEYERKLREYVEKEQTIPLGGVGARLLNPESRWGVAALRTVFAVVAKTGLWKAVNPGESEKWQLPNYSAFAQ